MKVLSYPYTFTTRSVLRHLIDYSKVVPLIKHVNANVYISIDCMVETYIAQKVTPRKKHVIRVQDPLTGKDCRPPGLIDPNYRINVIGEELVSRLEEVLTLFREELVDISVEL